MMTIHAVCVRSGFNSAVVMYHSEVVYCSLMFLETDRISSNSIYKGNRGSRADQNLILIQL